MSVSNAGAQLVMLRFSAKARMVVPLAPAAAMAFVAMEFGGGWWRWRRLVIMVVIVVVLVVVVVVVHKLWKRGC